MGVPYAEQGGGGGSRAANSDRGLVLGEGGVSENWIAGSAAARLFFLTAIAIAIATRPFKFHEISVSYTSSSFVSSIHSLAWKYAIPMCLFAMLVQYSYVLFHVAVRVLVNNSNMLIYVAVHMEIRHFP